VVVVDDQGHRLAVSILNRSATANRRFRLLITRPWAGTPSHASPSVRAVPTGSVVDLTVQVERETSVDEINAAFRERGDSGALESILAYPEDPIVSTDPVRARSLRSSTQG
jgi:hypothetical protein